MLIYTIKFSFCSSIPNNGGKSVPLHRESAFLTLKTQDCLVSTTRKQQGRREWKLSEGEVFWKPSLGRMFTISAYFPLARTQFYDTLFFKRGWKLQLSCFHRMVHTFGKQLSRHCHTDWGWKGHQDLTECKLNMKNNEHSQMLMQY